MSISRKLREKIKESARHRCGYCQMPAELIYTQIEIEHIVPVSKGGTDDEENLWLACSNCNTYKSNLIEAIDPETQELVSLFNPRQQVWYEHFGFNSENPAMIFGKTPCGRATVEALRINMPQMIAFRNLMVTFKKYPPLD